MPLKLRNTAAVLCIAIAMFATIVSAIDIAAPALLLVAFWQIVPIVRSVLRRDAGHGREQTSALLSLAASRAPPRFALYA